MLPVEFLVTAANSSERAALLKMLKADVTYIADRGYMSFKVCHEVIRAKAHFVFRVKGGLLFTVTEALPVQLPETVRGLFNDVTDELIRYPNDEFKHVYRLVYFSVGREVFRLLTDRRDLTTFQVIMLYAYRWQIEIYQPYCLCKTLKSFSFGSTLRSWLAMITHSAWFHAALSGDKIAVY